MKRRAAALCLLLLLAACPRALAAESAAEKLAQRLDLTALEELDAGFPVRETVRRLLNGDWQGPEELLKTLRDQAKEALRAALAQMGALLAPFCALAVVNALLGDELRGTAARVCALAAAAEALAFVAGAAGEAARAVRRVNALAGALAPVLATLLSASGGVGSAALLTPFAALAARFGEEALAGGTIPLAGCCAVLAACPALSPRFSFVGVRRLLLRLCNWTHAALLTAFTGVLAVRGLLAGGADSVSMRTAKYTVDNLLPVVGGEIADSLEMLVSSARLVRTCVGTTGCLLLLALCARPLLLVGGRLVALRLCAALAEPLEAKAPQAVLEGLAEALRALLAALASAMMLFLLLVGATAALSLTIF